LLDAQLKEFQFNYWLITALQLCKSQLFFIKVNKIMTKICPFCFTLSQKISGQLVTA